MVFNIFRCDKSESSSSKAGDGGVMIVLDKKIAAINISMDNSTIEEIYVKIEFKTELRIYCLCLHSSWC